jgi:hypothetical protein
MSERQLPLSRYRLRSGDIVVVETIDTQEV